MIVLCLPRIVVTNSLKSTEGPIISSSCSQNIRPYMMNACSSLCLGKLPGAGVNTPSGQAIYLYLLPIREWIETGRLVLNDRPTHSSIEYWGYRLVFDTINFHRIRWGIEICWERSHVRLGRYRSLLRHIYVLSCDTLLGPCLSWPSCWFLISREH